MTTVTSSTVEDLMALPPGPFRDDLLNGQIRRRPYSLIVNGMVAGTLCWRIGTAAEAGRFGSTHASSGFILRRDPDTLLVPKIAVVAGPRPPAGERDDFLARAPDLAINLVAPTDDAGYVRDKVTAYLDAGSRLVWVVDPREETATVWAPGRSSRVYRGDETLDGGNVLSGFTVAVSEIFESTW